MPSLLEMQYVSTDWEDVLDKSILPETPTLPLLASLQGYPRAQWVMQHIYGLNAIHTVLFIFIYMMVLAGVIGFFTALVMMNNNSDGGVIGLIMLGLLIGTLIGIVGAEFLIVYRKHMKGCVHKLWDVAMQDERTIDGYDTGRLPMGLWSAWVCGIGQLWHVLRWLAIAGIPVAFILGAMAEGPFAGILFVILHLIVAIIILWAVLIVGQFFMLLYCMRICPLMGAYRVSKLIRVLLFVAPSFLALVVMIGLVWFGFFDQFVSENGLFILVNCLLVIFTLAWLGAIGLMIKIAADLDGIGKQLREVMDYYKAEAEKQ